MKLNPRQLSVLIAVLDEKIASVKSQSLMQVLASIRAEAWRYLQDCREKARQRQWVHGPFRQEEDDGDSTD